MAARNVSVERFKKLTEELKDEVRTDAIAELNTQAGELANLIQSVAPREEGKLAHSIRVIPGDKPTIVRVVGGGRATTATTSGRPYDYSRAVEFGTQEVSPQPFFFPSYRLRKKKIIAAMKRRIRANIKKRSAE